MITSLDQVTEFPLCWPETKPRTGQRKASPFQKKSGAKVERELADELQRWGVGARSYVVSRSPRYARGAYDPAVAVWFNMRPKKPGEPPQLRVLACDTYADPDHNIWAIYLTLQALRAAERYGTYTLDQAIQGAAPLALPSPDGPPWWEVLRVKPDWPLDAIEMAWKNALVAAHPDRPGGSAERAAEINAAFERAKQEKRA